MRLWKKDSKIYLTNMRRLEGNTYLLIDALTFHNIYPSKAHKCIRRASLSNCTVSVVLLQKFIRNILVLPCFVPRIEPTLVRGRSIFGLVIYPDLLEGIDG